MGDRVTCKAVLAKEAGLLYLSVPYGRDDPQRLITLPVRPRATPRVRGPEWEYEIQGDRLHVHPSLLCPMAEPVFHTDLDWSCAFEMCPPGVSGYDHFYALNPRSEPSQPSQPSQSAQPAVTAPQVSVAPSCQREGCGKVLQQPRDRHVLFIRDGERGQARRAVFCKACVTLIAGKL